MNRRLLLSCVALLSIGYAAVITVQNVRHIRAMPDANRVVISSLQPLMAAAEPVRIVERSASVKVIDGSLERKDVHVEYGRQVFPASRAVWVNTALPPSDPGRYLQRFRAGYLRYDAHIESLFLIEVHQDFGDHGDEPRANLWAFPMQQRSDGAAIFDAVAEAGFAHNIKISEARRDPHWRAVFADSHARLVRAFPALAAVLVGLAALGSLLITLWREQPWAVLATTITFVLPIVSAAPFLTAFGWMPIMAAVVLGFFITTAVVCAIDQRLMPHLQTNLRARAVRRSADAILVPVAALLVGTTLTVSFASVSVIPLQGLGSATPGEIFIQSLVAPATGLLLGGIGTCVLLAVFRLILNWRNHPRKPEARHIE